MVMYHDCSFFLQRDCFLSGLVQSFSPPRPQTHLVLTPAEGGQAPDPTEDPAGASAAAATATTPGSATAAATAAAAAATADGGGAAVDAEGNTLDPESLLAQLFELLMALVGLHR